MKHIKKFNEGFLDIFNKKEDDTKVSINSIKDCFRDIEEDDRIERVYPNFSINDNTIVTKIYYNPSTISDEEVTEIINNCVDKLELYNCKVTYSISWSIGDAPEGGSSDREWNNFSDMLDKTVIKYKKDYYNRTISIKIKPSGKLI